MENKTLAAALITLLHGQYWLLMNMSGDRQDLADNCTEMAEKIMQEVPEAIALLGLDAEGRK